MKKSISIIIPYYKGERHIFKNLDSIFKSYNFVKKIIDLEVLVILDSVEDQDYISSKLKKKYNNKIKLIKNNKNLGVAASRNIGKKLAKNKFLIFLDQDDFIDEKFFLEITPYLKDKNDIILVNGYYFNSISNKKIPIYYFKPKLSLRSFLKGNKIPTPGLLIINKDKIDYNPFFISCSNKFKGTDDWAALINLFLQKPNIRFKYVRKKIFYYNLHDNNYSNNIHKMNESAIATANYFIKNLSNNHKKILKKKIKALRFEMLMYSNVSKMKLILNNFSSFLNYINSKATLNRILGLINKYLIKFYG